MIVCPNCKHENPEGATNCEACYTALPAMKACPACGASIQLEATFCGQCGHNLKSSGSKASPIHLPPPTAEAGGSTTPESPNVVLQPTVLTNKEAKSAVNSIEPEIDPILPDPFLAPLPEIAPEVESSPPPLNEVGAEPLGSEPASAPTPTPVVATQVQQSPSHLLHVQTNTILEIPVHLQVVHIGKPNEQTPPDIDVSGFPSAEVVSRIHANIRIEPGQNYYIEDVGSANGTYINHSVLAKGTRHLLQTGDRIGLGKGDLVTLIFQSSD
jgi:hypothetical protein